MTSTINATRAAKRLAETGAISLKEVRHLLGHNEEHRLGAADVRIAISQVEGSSNVIDLQTALESRKEYRRGEAEPRWDLLDFPVERQRIQTTPQEIKIPGRLALVRTDLNTVLNIVSTGYKVVSHREVFEPMSEAIVETGLPIHATRTDVGLNGGYARVKWTIGDPITIQPGDDVVFEAIGRNSYNYESMVGFEFGAWRLICTNGMKAPIDLQMTVSQKHMKNLSVAFVLARIRRFLDLTPRVVERWQQWADTPITIEALAKALEREVLFGKRATGTILEYYQRGGALTLWRAYNSLSWFATHQLRVRDDERRVVAEDQLHIAAVRVAARLQAAA